MGVNLVLRLLLPESFLMHESYLSGKHMKELAVGLEMSRFPFLALLNTLADVLKAKRQELEAEIFGDKAEGRGIVHSGWVNQQLMLRHSVGLFLSNSQYHGSCEAKS
ncbi:Anthocyanidin 3-O-glucosyltransferase [Nymphaea thermarum]|nr:Anthocyanidin 3-O-glucosyltransferase [Nymphaea thermarum]